MKLNRTTSSRAGFTLVELLVAMGLTLFIMTIIVEAFTLSMDAYSGFRALGDVQNQSRAALSMLKNDLANVRFEGARKLSDTAFWDTPVKEGFFAVRHGSQFQSTPGQPYVDEGFDNDNIHVYRATDHVLHFGVRMRENRRDQVFAATASTTPAATWKSTQVFATNMNSDATFGGSNATPMASPWAEVAYYLMPKVDSSGNQVSIIDPNPTAFGPIKLYNLYRLQLVVLPFVDKVNGQITYEPTIFSGNKATNKFYSPNDLAGGSTTRSFNPAAIDPNNDLIRSSLICTNVVSFQVRIMKDKDSANAASETGFVDPPPDKNNIRLFDSAVKPTAQAGQQPFRVIGAQVTLRVFDPSSGLTRQVTLIQDL